MCTAALRLLHVLYSTLGSTLERSTDRSTLEVPVVDEKARTLFWGCILYVYVRICMLVYVFVTVSCFVCVSCTVHVRVSRPVEVHQRSLWPLPLPQTALPQHAHKEGLYKPTSYVMCMHVHCTLYMHTYTGKVCYAFLCMTATQN